MARLTQLQDELKVWHRRPRRVRKAGDEIATIATSRHVGLVVMTRRRGQGLFGPRQGSISYEVLCKANTPVLALPSDKAGCGASLGGGPNIALAGAPAAYFAMRRRVHVHMAAHTAGRQRDLCVGSRFQIALGARFDQILAAHAKKHRSVEGSRAP